MNIWDTHFKIVQICTFHIACVIFQTPTLHNPLKIVRFSTRHRVAWRHQSAIFSKTSRRIFLKLCELMLNKVPSVSRVYGCPGFQAIENVRLGGGWGGRYMPPVNGGLSSAEFWGTGSKIPLDVKCIQDKVTLLLCDIHNLQDPATYGPSKIQDT